ncbi:MAG: sigma-70 family RNA polymerase sigma factor [Gammaproteobacteria bacterium]
MDAETKSTAADEQAAIDVEDNFRAMITSIAHKNEAALGTFYDTTIARVYAVALRITKRAEAAEEVASDVYLQVWQQGERFDTSRGSVMAWLLTICRSRALDYLRRRDKAESHPEPETLRPDLQIDENDPQDLLLTTERSSTVYAALESLAPNQRQLIALAFFKGQSHQEISDYTGMPLGTVKSHLRKALSVLREMLCDDPATVLGKVR